MAQSQPPRSFAAFPRTLTPRNRVGVRIGASIALFTPLLAAPFLGGSMSATAAPSPITGVIFNDQDGNGTQGSGEPGIGGVSIAAYDATGASVGSASSSAVATIGAFSISGTDNATQYRVEVTKPTGYEVGPKGTPLTSFATGGATVNVGLFDPSAWCQSNPSAASSCFKNGDSSDGTVSPASGLFTFPTSVSGSPAQTNRGTLGEIGSVWGLARKPSNGTIYAAAYVKRHAGLTAAGAGAIYASPVAGSPSLLATIPNVGFSATNAARGLSLLSSPSQDDQAFSVVGTQGLGGMDLSGDESTLYVVNLNDQSIYPVSTSNGTVGSPIAIPTVPCVSGSARPFGLVWRAGKIYVGVVCDASSGTASNLTARVEAYDGAAWTTALSFPLDFTKGCSVTWTSAPTTCAWYPWSDTLTPFTGTTYSEPQPMLTGLDFDSKGALIMGFRDRNGDRFGRSNLSPTSFGPSTNVEYQTGGDLMRARSNGGTTFTLESNADDGISAATAGANTSAGPGGGEFYFDESFPTVHEETATGAVASFGSSVLASVYDPADGARTTYTGGVETYSNTTGARLNGALLYNATAGNGTFGKASGLGDLELLCNAAPIEIGDRVWLDTDEDGVQDPGEVPLAGISVELRSGVTVVDTAVTDAQGTYLFSNASGTSTTSRRYGITALTAYATFNVVVPMTQSAITTNGYVLTAANAASSPSGGVDERDSDATPDVAGDARISLTTGAPGQNNHSYDIGFKTPAALTYCLGNRIWIDTDDSGTVNNGEVGLDGIVVTLTNVTTSATLTDTTSNIGYYEFCGLAAGDYRVSFTAPDGYRSSTANIDGETNPGDNDDNGTQTGAAIESNVITLGGPSEPTGEPATPGSSDTTPDNQSNLTVDFGLVPTYCFGNRIWRDVDDDGTINNGETGYDGITVTLLNAAVVTQGTQVTANGGYYLFCGLDAGLYRAQFAPPSGYRSSSPNNDAEAVATDNDDNGDLNATVIRSVLVTLGGSPEPTGEPMTPGYSNTTADNRSNLTVDFGLYQLPTVASLGDKVWQDLNSNGLQDSGEPGVDNVTVELLDSAGNPFTVPVTQLTSGGGMYLFTGLTPGTYAVRFTPPSGATFTSRDSGADGLDSDADTATGTTGFYTLVGGQSDITVDAGIIPVVSGTTSTTTTSTTTTSTTTTSTTTTSTTTTSTTTTVPDGTTTTSPDTTTTTTTTVTLPPPFIVPPNSTTTTVAPSTVPPTTVAPSSVVSTTTPPTTVPPSTSTIPCVSIGDDVYSDRNRNGVRDDNERGIPNASVTVRLADGRVITAITDANGKYSVVCLPPGTVSVTVSGVDPLAKPTTPTVLDPFSLQVSRLDADFGFDMSSVLGFDIEAAPSIAFTGSNSHHELQIASWMLSAGGALILVVTRRRKVPRSTKARS